MRRELPLAQAGPPHFVEDDFFLQRVGGAATFGA